MNSPETRSMRRILLATDLSPRCDRAFDRAVLLAREFGAQLIVASVLDPAQSQQYSFDPAQRSWRKLSDPTERIRLRLQRDIAATDANMSIIVEEGVPSQKLAEIAIREDCDFIVTGTAQGENFGQALLGSTINRLARDISVPILVVYDRPTVAYRHIAVTTDFSDASFLALDKVAALFPKARVTLFHAYDLPFAGLIADRDIVAEQREITRELTAKLAQDDRVIPALRERLTLVVEHGPLEALLGLFAEQYEVDLTVIGSQGRGPLFDAIIGSTAKRLVNSLEGDLLIVRSPDTRN